MVSVSIWDVKMFILTFYLFVNAAVWHRFGCSLFHKSEEIRKFVTQLTSLKLYCKYLYTRPCMINHIWGLKQLWLQVNGHAWFHLLCNGSVDLFGTGRERKIQNENICLQRDSNPHPASPRQESFSALDRSATRAWWWSVVKCLAW